MNPTGMRVIVTYKDRVQFGVTVDYDPGTGGWWERKWELVWAYSKVAAEEIVKARYEQMGVEFEILGCSKVLPKYPDVRRVELLPCVY